MMNKLITSLTLVLGISSAAFAEGAGGTAAGGGYGSILMLVAFIAIFYFLMIRPQMKRNKEHKRMLSNIDKGDEVATSGGLVGKISEVGENFIEVAVAEGVTVKIQKNAITSVLPKGTVKTS